MLFCVLSLLTLRSFWKHNVFAGLHLNLYCTVFTSRWRCPRKQGKETPSSPQPQESMSFSPRPAGSGEKRPPAPGLEVASPSPSPRKICRFSPSPPGRGEATSSPGAGGRSSLSPWGREKRNMLWKVLTFRFSPPRGGEGWENRHISQWSEGRFPACLLRIPHSATFATFQGKQLPL